MSLSLLATIFDRDTLSIKSIIPLIVYDIQMDALSNQTSSFGIINESATIGDYIAVRAINTNKVIYYGQITTIDQNENSEQITLTANYIWNVFNGDVVVKSYSGDYYESHIASMINTYFVPNNNKLLASISHSTGTPFSITNSNGLSVSNFIDYLIRGFKLHNVVLSVSNIKQGMSNGVPFYYPEIDIHQVTESRDFKNNIVAFTGWHVTDSRLLRGYANELWIVDKASGDIENPTILAKYWLQSDGNVVNQINNGVNQPTQISIYLYDKTATDNLSYDNIGQANLGQNPYSHNIQFSTTQDNNFFSVDALQLGLQSNVYYNQQVYQSVLTAYSLSSESDLINLTFGNLRFNKNDIFENN